MRTARASDLDRGYGEDFDLRRKLKGIEAELDELRAIVLSGTVPVPSPTGGISPPGPATVGANIYAASFAAAATWTILGSQHAFTTADMTVTCYNAGSPRKVIVPTSVSVNLTTRDVTVTWAFATGGRVVIAGLRA